MSKPEEMLPPEWSKQYSKTHQRDYWFNSSDGSRSWEPPAVVDEEPASKRSRTVAPPPSVVREDSPLMSVERARLLNSCFDLFVAENAKFGDMQGHSKTAKACKKDGMKVGLQGMFGRIVWTQLLRHVQTNGDIGSDPTSDAVFVPAPVTDEAVTQELHEAGRSPEQAQRVMSTVYAKLRDACASLVQAQSSSSGSTAAVSLQGKLAQPDGQLQGDVMYRLSFSHAAYVISGKHLEKLLRLYSLHTHPGCAVTDPVFLRRVFCVIARYELLSGSSDGYQMAFPDAGFQWLRRHVGVTAECFASPLNCWNDRFCSVARDTDRFFGSMGNFFHFNGSSSLSSSDGGGGSFEANPPFVESIMDEMAAKIEDILSKETALPFSFSVIVPAWTGCLGIDIMTNSRFLRPNPKFVLRLEKKKHAYRPGMQHRTDHAEQPSNVDTLVFFLQNDKGAARWPVTVALAEDLQKKMEAGC
jgi:hypothetical protein